MTTYKEIQKRIKEKYGFSAKSCWIAHIKELNGIEMRKAANRIDETKRKYPCPKHKRQAIESTMKELSVI